MTRENSSAEIKPMNSTSCSINSNFKSLNRQRRHTNPRNAKRNPAGLCCGFPDGRDEVKSGHMHRHQFMNPWLLVVEMTESRRGKSDADTVTKPNL